MKSKFNTAGLILVICAILCLNLGDCIAAQEDGAQEQVGRAKEFYHAGQKFMREGNFTAANDAFMKAETILRSEGSIVPETAPGPSAAAAITQIVEPPPAPASQTLSPDIYYNLGVAALEKGDFIQAEAAFKRVVELDPQDKDACYNLGVLYEKFLNKKKEAVKYYLRYINLSGSESTDVERVKGWVKALEQETRAK